MTITDVVRDYCRLTGRWGLLLMCPDIAPASQEMQLGELQRLAPGLAETTWQALRVYGEAVEMFGSMAACVAAFKSIETPGAPTADHPFGNPFVVRAIMFDTAGFTRDWNFEKKHVP